MRSFWFAGWFLLVLITVLLDERSMCERGEALGPGLPALGGGCEARAHTGTLGLQNRHHRARSFRQHFRRRSARKMRCRRRCWIGAHDNQIGMTLLREIDDAGSRRSSGKASAQPRTWREILREIEMDGILERYPIDVVFWLARTLHMEEHQLCFIRGSEFLRIGDNRG